MSTARRLAGRHALARPLQRQTSCFLRLRLMRHRLEWFQSKSCLGGTMADQPEVQVSRLLDERGLSSFQIKLLIWSFFIGLAAIFGLPESIKYMALHERQRGRMEALIADIRPGFKVPANARFVIEDEKQFPGFNPVYLFREGLAAITPLLWLLFALNLMGYFFLLSWTPTLLTAAKVPPAAGAPAGAGLQVGGTVGALALCGLLQRHRFLAIAIMFVIAVPVVGSIGFAGLTSQPALLTATFFAGFLVLGIQSGINVVGAMIYPTSLRANGSGWQLGIGRIGSIVGPLVGAVFVGLPVERLYMWAALPFAVGAVICFIIHRLNAARLAARPELRKAQ